jgi:hypothetical protein
MIGGRHVDESSTVVREDHEDKEQVEDVTLSGERTHPTGRLKLTDRPRVVDRARFSDAIGGVIWLRYCMSRNR